MATNLSKLMKQLGGKSNAPDFNVDLGKSNFQGYVRQGIQDRTGALKTANQFNDLGNVAGLAMKAGKAYAEYDVLSGVADEVNKVVQDQQDRSLAGQQQTYSEIVEGSEAINTARVKHGYDGTYPEMLNQQLMDDTVGIRNALVDKTDKLTRAKQQGVMSELELSNRLAKITREAITANPAFADQIMAHVNKVANINNITANVKGDLATIKAQKDAEQGMIDDLIDDAQKFNVPIHSQAFKLSDGSYNLDKIAEETTLRQNEKDMYDSYKMLKANKDVLKDIDIENFLAEGDGYKLNNAIYANTTNEFTAIANNDQMKPEDKLKAMQMIIDTEMADLRESYRKAGGYSNDERVKPLIDNLEKSLTNLQKIYTDQINGTTSATVAKNELSVLEDREMKRFYERNPGAKQTLAMIKTLEGINIDTKILNKRHGLIEQVLSYQVAPPEVTAPSKRNEGLSPKVEANFQPMGRKGSVASRYSMETLQVAIDDVNDDTHADFLESMEKRINYLNNPQALHKTAEVAQLIKDLNHPNGDEMVRLIGIDPYVKEGVVEAVQAYVPLLKNTYTDYKKNNPDVKLEMVNGRFTLKSNNMYKHSSFMSNELRSINQTYNAWVKVNGEGEDAMQSFYDMITK